MGWILLLLVLHTAPALRASKLRMTDKARGNVSDESPSDEGCSGTFDSIWPDWPGAAKYSCQGACGSVRALPCSCDPLCAVMGDCCQDFFLLCPGPAPPAMAPPHAGPNGSHADRTSARGPPPMAECTVLHARLIAACPLNPGDQSPQAAARQALCQQDLSSAAASVQTLLPVTDRATGYHFKNIHCFLCNGAKRQDGLLWSLKIARSYFRGGFPFRSLQDALNLAANNGSLLYALPPEGVTNRLCVPDYVWAANPLPCDCPNLRDLCQSVDSYVISLSLLFRNSYCLICYMNALAIVPEKLTVPTQQLLEHFRAPTAFSILMKWNLEQESEAAEGLESLTEPESSVSSFIEFTSDRMPWTRMVCKNHQGNKSNSNIVRTSSGTTASLASRFLEQPPPAADNGSNGNQLDASNKEATSTMPTAAATGATGKSLEQPKPQHMFSDCSATECRLRLVLLQGKCSDEVYSIIVKVLYSKDEHLVKALQSLSSVSPRPETEIEGKLHEDPRFRHPNVRLLDQHINLDETAMTLTVRAIFERDRSNISEFEDPVLAAMVNHTVDLVTTTLVETLGANPRALTVCSKQHNGIKIREEGDFCELESSIASPHTPRNAACSSGICGWWQQIMWIFVACVLAFAFSHNTKATRNTGDILL